MNILNEALSRARMSQPHGEASQRHGDGSLRVAMRARARQARELGEASQSAGQ
jgi:hypothetical protein